MIHKHSFRLVSHDPRRKLPEKITIGRGQEGLPEEIILTLLGYLVLFNQRLEIGGRLISEEMPYVPALVELDDSLRPLRWCEAGEIGFKHLKKIAIKAPDAEIWIFQASAAQAEETLQRIRKEGLRRDRYRLIGFESGMVEELEGLLVARNDLTWIQGDMEALTLQFDFNGLWFEGGFMTLAY